MTQAVFEKEFVANYPGDVSGIVDRRELLGPNLLGEYFVAMSAEYDAETDKTRVEFRLIPASGMERLYDAIYNAA